MISIQELTYAEIEKMLGENGFPAFRAAQVYKMAVLNKNFFEGNIPKDLRDFLSERYYATAVEIIKTLDGADGAKKYLYRLNDGVLIEGVFMPHGYGNTLCVSTQAGCRMGCAFCASGINGLERNLTAGEILGQVLAANREEGGTSDKRAITNIVLMGSGEPLDNYDNVINFFKLISEKDGINISMRNISLSTVGIPEKIKKLADGGYPVTLSVSLHAPTDEKRSRLIPANRAYGISAVISAARYYFEKTGRRIIFEYALVKGENSDSESANELVSLLRGLPCHVNLIPLNSVEEKNLSGAGKAAVSEFLRILTEKNISSTVRRSMGGDIGGACGQLRNNTLRN